MWSLRWSRSTCQLSLNLGLGLISSTSAFQCGCKAGVGDDIHLDANVDVAWGWRDFGCSIEVVSLAVDVGVSGHACPQLVCSPFDIKLPASSNLGFEIWAIWHPRSSLDFFNQIMHVFKVIKKALPGWRQDWLQSRLWSPGVVQAFIDVEVDGGVEEDVAIDGSPSIQVSGVDCELGVVQAPLVSGWRRRWRRRCHWRLVSTRVDWELLELGGGNFDVDGHIVAVWVVLKVPLCVESPIGKTVGTPPLMLGVLLMLVPSSWCWGLISWCWDFWLPHLGCPSQWRSFRHECEFFTSFLHYHLPPNLTKMWRLTFLSCVMGWPSYHWVFVSSLRWIHGPCLAPSKNSRYLNFLYCYFYRTLLKLHVPLNLLTPWALVSWWSWDGTDGQTTLKAGTSSCVFFQTNVPQCPDGLMDRWHSKLEQLLVSSSSRRMSLNILLAWWTDDTQSWNLFLCLLPDRWHYDLDGRALMDRWHSELGPLLVSPPRQVTLWPWWTGLDGQVTLNTLCLVSLVPETLKDWMSLWCLVSSR